MKDIRAVQHVSTYDALQEDDLVVVNLEECVEEQPYIAKVLEINENDVKVQWMKGGYNKKWREWVDGVGKNRKANVDVIPIRSILLFGFRLTPNGNLPKNKVAEIKKLYEEV